MSVTYSKNGEHFRAHIRRSLQRKRDLAKMMFRLTGKSYYDVVARDQDIDALFANGMIGGDMPLPPRAL